MTFYTKEIAESAWNRKLQKIVEKIVWAGGITLVFWGCASLASQLEEKTATMSLGEAAPQLSNAPSMSMRPSLVLHKPEQAKH